MSKKVKPSGKFKYDLETVLKVRGIKEKKEQEVFAERQIEFNKEKDKEEKIESEREGRRSELRGIMSKGPISDFAKILRRKAHLGKLKEDLDKQVEKVIEASSKLEEQRTKLIDSMKDRKLIEKHKGKKLDEYKKLMQDLEIKFLDEVATERYNKEND